MGIKRTASIAVYLSSAVANGSTFTVPYPEGTSAINFEFDNTAEVVINQATKSLPAAFGASAITVTNNTGATIAPTDVKNLSIGYLERTEAADAEDGDAVDSVRYTTDEDGRINGLAGADFPIREQLQALPSGQPIGITRPVSHIGKKVVGFSSTDGWWLAGGVEGTDVATTQDFTGLDPTSGAITGITSRTGAVAMRKMQVLTNGTISLGKTSGLNVALRGKIGIWVYVDSPSGTTPNLTISIKGDVAYNFNGNQIKPNAWNFLAAVRSADPVSNSDVEAHPFGLSEDIYAYANVPWVTANTTSLWLSCQNCAGVTFYFDSVWTGWQHQAQFVLGADMTGNDTIAHVLPKFREKGWVGYIAEPFRVQSSPWADVLDWSANGSSVWLDAVYAAGWDIINHSVNHQAIGTYTNPAHIRYEIEASRSWLDALGYIRGREFYASPTSSTSALSREVIKQTGIKLQRHGTHDANHVTAFGVDNLEWVGGVDIGGNGWLHSSTDPVHYPYAYPHIANLRTWVDMIIKYGATGMPFWHGVKTLGDPGDGSGNPGSAVQMFKSTFDLFMDYLAQKEAAGLCRVTDGMSGFYYGRGR